ncbi:MAG: hypothetical protein JXA11_12320 [Phycisphaerae bacterium]|nr:hypothetical protein [Phycisphaerae bacterium]
MHSGWLSAVMTMLLAAITPAQTIESSTVQSWRVKVDFDQPIKTMDPAYASANVNRPGLMVRDEAFDQAVKSLGFRMMRFQGPFEKKFDYKTPLTEKDFTTLDAAVDKARGKWGVKELLIGIHRIHTPTDENGKLIHADFPVYAKRCAELVKRYAPPGNVRVRYWEPFNEQDAEKRIKKLKAHGQSYADVAKLYVVCAKAMKAVNPDILVGGPALCDAAAGKLRTFLQGTEGLVDFVSWHDYPAGNPDTPDEKVLSSVTGNARFVGGARKLQAVLDSFPCGKVPLFLDEYQVNYRGWDPPDVRMATQFGAVFVASVLAEMSDSPVERMFVHDIFTQSYGLVGPVAKDRFAAQSGVVMDKSGVEAPHVRPSGWVFRWFNQYAGGQWVRCDVKMSEADRAHERGPLLIVCAWRNDDARVVMLVNKDVQPRKVTLHLGKEIPSDGFALPLRVMTIADGRPGETRTSGTKKGQITWFLPDMSVTFIVHEETPKEADTP